MITVEGRVLNAPRLKYSNNAIIPAEGSWNLMQKKFGAGAIIRDWSYLILYYKGSTQILSNAPPAVDAFTRMMTTCGLQVQGPMPKAGYSLMVGENFEVEDAALRDLFDRISKGATKMLLVILPDTTASRYSRIKLWGDVKFGIHTVCAVASKMLNEKGQNMYFANVALKFNLKRGGYNHMLEPDKQGIIRDGKTMVVGIDVTHPSPNSMKGAPSVAGVVASIDARLGQWPASIGIQEGRKEMVTDLEAMMVARLKVWQKKNNNSLPNKILVYRDGVSEGQYGIVLREEFPQIQAACDRLYPAKGPKPKISIVVVGKRHHTRFYPTKDEEADRNGNTKNGTVVDRGVTSERYWDFFLQAHGSLQGTVRPAHYVVLRDEIGLGADGLEQLVNSSKCPNYISSIRAS